MADGSDAYSVVLRFEADEESLRKIQEQLDNMHIPIQVTRRPKSTSSDDDSDADPGDTGKESKGTASKLKDAFKDYLADDQNRSKLITNTIKSSEVAISAGLKKGFGIVEDIYARLKASSPLLQAIESLFQLAMTLFFMPLGNKLGEVLIPATLDLLEAVMDLWDEYGDGKLGDMFGVAITKGIEIISGYFNNIGDTLIEQGGMVASIGKLIKTMASFLSTSGATLLNGILTVVTTLLANLKHFISIYIGLKGAEMANNALGILKLIPGATLLSSAAGFAAGTAIGEIGLTAIGLAEGGYVPATPGGQLRVLGEGGRGEYVIPEDKMGNVGGGTIINNFYGYNEDQLVQKVNDVVNQQVSLSRLRSGF